MRAYKISKVAGLMLGLLLMINSASASLLLEPHLGLNISGSGEGEIASLAHEYDYNGLQLGARVGFQQLGFMVGLDYTRSTFDLKDSYSGTSVTDSTSRNELGIFAGYNLPILLRAWGAYYFSNSAKDGRGNKYSGNTKELGVGFTALPFLSINMMYRMVTWDEYNSAKISNDINATELVLGVSLPLTL